MRLMRITEVCSQVGLGRATIYRYVATGNFPAPVKVGGAALWPSDDVDSWIQDQIRRARGSAAVAEGEGT